MKRSHAATNELEYTKCTYFALMEIMSCEVYENVNKTSAMYSKSKRLYEHLNKHKELLQTVCEAK